MVSNTLTDAVAAVGKLRADDRLITDTGQQLDELEVVFDLITVLQSVATDRIAEATKVGATAEQCGRSPKRWLVEDTLMAGPEASRYVNLAKWLEDFPLTRDAFAAARLSAAHANEICKAMRWLPREYWPQVEPELVDYGLTSHGQRTVMGTLNPEVGEKVEKALAIAAQKAGPDDDRTQRQRQHD